MKNLFILPILCISLIAGAQPIVQPLASGDYWRIEEYNQKLREFANTRTLNTPARINFPSGNLGVSYMRASRLTGVNEIEWITSPATNVSMFYVEYSRNNRDFERAGQVTLLQTEDGDCYVFRHPFNDNSLVYYRVAVVNKNNNVVAYSPVVQLAEEEFSTKIYPTVVRGSTFHVQAGVPYETLHVLAGDGKVVYVKPLNDATGTLTIGLPDLPAGAYFVRLTSSKRPQHVQKIFIE